MNAINGDVIQPHISFNTIFHLTPLPPLATPTPTKAPITACVLDTGTAGSGGIPRDTKKLSNVSDENSMSTNDWDNITIKPTAGDTFNTFYENEIK